VTKRISLLMILMLGLLVAGCNQNQTANTQDNANATAVASPATTVAPDNSEVVTTTDASGTRTDTRTFKDHSRIERVTVSTTRSGVRTVKAVSKSGEEKVVNTTEDVLQASGDAIADAAGFVADKGEDAIGEAGDKAEDVGDKTVSGAKKVGATVADKAEDVGDKTVSGAKKVGDKTVEGAKTAGSATKKAVKKVIP
jgi:hypothetical protein